MLAIPCDFAAVSHAVEYASQDWGLGTHVHGLENILTVRVGHPVALAALQGPLWKQLKSSPLRKSSAVQAGAENSRCGQVCSLVDAGVACLRLRLAHAALVSRGW